MVYLIVFLEGIITFISPCMLPMLPVYVSYFAGNNKKGNTEIIKISLAFVFGFTLVFTLLGALGGALGSLFVKYKTVLDIITGGIVIIFGLSFLGVLNLKMFKGINSTFSSSGLGVFSSFLFGLVFSVGWTPCVGAFLGSALMLASYEGSAFKGVIMLLLYSMGLGVPFVICGVLIDTFKSAFNFIKKHYRIINTVCGIFLIISGLAMMFGLFGKLLGGLI